MIPACWGAMRGPLSPISDPVAAPSATTKARIQNMSGFFLPMEPFPHARATRSPVLAICVFVLFK